MRKSWGREKVSNFDFWVWSDFLVFCDNNEKKKIKAFTLQLPRAREAAQHDSQACT